MSLEIPMKWVLGVPLPKNTNKIIPEVCRLRRTHASSVASKSSWSSSKQQTSWLESLVQITHVWCSCTSQVLWFWLNLMAVAILSHFVSLSVLQLILTFDVTQIELGDLIAIFFFSFLAFSHLQFCECTSRMATNWCNNRAEIMG